MDLFGSLASPLPALSDITVNKSNAAAREPVRQSRGPGEGVQMASASVLARMSPSPPQLCVTAHRTSMFFLLAVSVAGLNNPKPVPEPRPGAPQRLIINATTYSGL